MQSSLLKRFWLVFAQAATVCVALLFVLTTLRPDLLSVPTASRTGSVVTVQQAPVPAPGARSGGTMPGSFSEAAKRGVFAYVIVQDDPQELESALEITLLRFAEFHNLEGAFGRRATIEQAKGVLMERFGIDSEQAFLQLRQHSQATGRKVVDVARAIVESHRLLREPEGNNRATGRTEVERDVEPRGVEPSAD